MEIIDEHAIWSEDHNFIFQVFSNDSVEIYRTLAPDKMVPQSKDITLLDNEQLTREATIGEITQAVNQASLLKALGLDRKHAIFYQNV